MLRAKFTVTHKARPVLVGVRQIAHEEDGQEGVTKNLSKVEMACWGGTGNVERGPDPVAKRPRQ